MNKVSCFVRLHAKTVAGALTAGLMYLAARFAIQLPPGAETAIVAFVTSAVVYFVPNECCSGECAGQSARPVS